jgi:hypothetical protein
MGIQWRRIRDFLPATALPAVPENAQQTTWQDPSSPNIMLRSAFCAERTKTKIERHRGTPVKLAGSTHRNVCIERLLLGPPYPSRAKAGSAQTLPFSRKARLSACGTHRQAKDAKACKGFLEGPGSSLRSWRAWRENSGFILDTVRLAGAFSIRLRPRILEGSSLPGSDHGPAQPQIPFAKRDHGNRR